MGLKIIKKYFWNCFLLLIPVFIWNVLLFDSLPESYDPEVFWKDIPKIIGNSENVLRIIVFTLPVIMILALKTKIQKVGLLTYLIGLILYFLSWTIVIIYPESSWSQSIIGFTAPAFTTIIWFVGVGLIGNKTFFKFPHLSTIYISISILFVMLHTLHTYIIFQRL